MNMKKFQLFYSKSYWTSLIEWFGNNGIKFPNHLISKITDNIDDFKILLDKKFYFLIF